jgi:hypothetical protein
MKTSEPPPLVRLRTLLYDATTSPADAARALLAERARAVGDGPLAHELLDIELRWLSAQREAGERELAAELGAVRSTWLAMRVRGLAAAPPGDPATMFDLAEAQAAAIAHGEQPLAAICEEAISRSLPLIQASPELDQEVAERFALLSTAIDEVPLPHQVHLLACSGSLVKRLAVQTGSKKCRKFGRRLQRAADDRELARRLEARIGWRGITAVETANFVLLLVVLVVLLIETSVDLSPAQANVLHVIDAAACSFFIADFLFELALHPRRLSWFLRNAVTDLLPALPSVLLFMPGANVPGVAENAVVLRALRVLRVTWAARYVQALRPLLRSMRLLLFLVRGLDGLAARFQQLLNREFVFVPAAADVDRSVPEEDLRDVAFTSLRREHELVALLSGEAKVDALRERTHAVGKAVESLGPRKGPLRRASESLRDIPMDQAIEFLWSLKAPDVGRWLRPADVQALDRVLRVLSAVPVRWLPIVRRLAVTPLPPTPEERIVQLARRYFFDLYIFSYALYIFFIHRKHFVYTPLTFFNA